MPKTQLLVWSALTDEGLERRLRYYLWLSTIVPNTHERRVEQLIAEACRRGKPEMVERAKMWLAFHDATPRL